MNTRQTIAHYLDTPRTERDYKAWVEHELERLDREHNVIRSMSQLIGWEFLRLERFKPNVVKFYARKPYAGGMEFQMGYAKDELFQSWQLPPIEP